MVLLKKSHNYIFVGSECSLIERDFFWNTIWVVPRDSPYFIVLHYALSTMDIILGENKHCSLVCSPLRQAHKSVCAYEQVECVNEGCKQMVKREDVGKHVETCAFVPTICTWCSVSIPKCNIEVSSNTQQQNFGTCIIIVQG